MERFRSLLIAAIFAAAVQSTTTQANMWPGQVGANTYAPGQWFIGAGVAGGIYTRPDWRAPVAVFPDPGIDNRRPFQLAFEQDLGIAGPGATLGFTFQNGTLPSWVGQSARLVFSFGYWHGSRTDRSVDGVFDDPDAVFFTQSGFVGFSAFIGGGNTSFEQRLKSKWHALEFALRLAGDHALQPHLVLTPSVGIFGGYSHSQYEFTALVSDAGVPAAFYSLDQKLNSYRVGGDAGLALTWLTLGGNLRLTIGGRIGVYWIRSRVMGEDCFFNGLGPPCPTPAGVFIPNAAFNTSGSGSESTIGVRTTLNGAIAYVWGRFTFTLGGFFAWESAVPGVSNPAANLGNQQAVTTFVGGPRVNHAGGIHAGGFFVVKFALN